MFFSDFETMPGWHLSLSFILIVTVVRLAESVVAPNGHSEVKSSSGGREVIRAPDPLLE